MLGVCLGDCWGGCWEMFGRLLGGRNVERVSI